jgi:putative transposase
LEALVHRTYRYPLHVSIRHEAVLCGWLEHCRQLYNGALEHRMGAWKRAKVSVNDVAQTAPLTEIRATDAEFARVPVIVSRSALRQLERAFQSFFRRLKTGESPGFPRFRTDGRYDSFSLGRVVPRVDRLKVRPSSAKRKKLALGSSR